MLTRDGRAREARRDQLLQAKVIEVHGEVLEEVGLVWVVAVAQHDLGTQLVTVVTQFLLDVRQLGVELVPWVAIASTQRFISRHSHTVQIQSDIAYSGYGVATTRLRIASLRDGQPARNA